MWQWNIDLLFFKIEWTERGKKTACVDVLVYNRQEKKPDFLNWKQHHIYFWTGQAEKEVQILDPSVLTERIIGTSYHYFTSSLPFLSTSECIFF